MSTKQTTWLWPDHAITKAESRNLREEHNALANSHAELLAACRALVDGAGEKDATAFFMRHDRAVQFARAAIAKATT